MNFFQGIYNSVISAAKLLTFRDIADIFLLAVLIFQLLKITHETRANQVLKGVGVALVASIIASWLSLRGVSWVLDYLINTGPLMLLVIFQPEIRNAFERVGRGKFFEIPGNNEFDYNEATNQIVRAATNLSKRKVGAFIVITAKSTVPDVVDSGTYMDAALSSALLENIFEPGTPLHDGAVIITNGRIVSAGCFSRTTSRTDLPQELGARHRAAIGITETSDVTSIVVSEETGTISAAYNGSLTRNLDLTDLRTHILAAYKRAGVMVDAKNKKGIRGIFGRSKKKNAPKQDSE